MAVEFASSQHLVRFYDGDDELIESVARYLADGLASGEAAIVVATEAHCRAFRAAMTGAGIDVDDARDTGRLVVLDAAETLSSFAVEGVLDPRGFDEVIGGLVRRAGQEGRSVRVYGEMVALLWDAGRVTTAIELEGLWNDLGRELPFSLFCAYPSSSFDEAQGQALEHVCRLHSDVVRPAEEARAFAGSLRSPGAARRFVREVLGRWGRADLVDDASAVVTELATNAVLHAESDFVVAVSRSNGAVRIGVRDAGTAPPVSRDGDLTTVSGRGIRLVSAMADRWGTEAVDDGKVVWAELRA